MNIKKRFLAIILAAAMAVCLLPGAAMAATNTVFIWGMELDNDTPYYHNGTNGAQGTVDNVATDYNAYYDMAAGTLYLNNLNVVDCTATPSAANAYDAIFTGGDLHIVLTGTNFVSTADNEGGLTRAIGINYGSLTLSGAGSLTAVGGDASALSYGVGVSNGSITLNSGALTGNAGKSAVSYGVYATYYITVNGGALTGNGGTLTTGMGDGISSGVLGNRGVTVNDGTLTGTGGDATDGDISAGVYAYAGYINVGGGALTGTGGNGSTSYGVAAHSSSAITISDGTLSASTTATTSATKAALSKALTLGTGMQAQGSVSGGGSNPVTYVAADNSTYMWVKAEPPPTPVTFDALTADGSATATTTKVTLVFSEDITGLAAGDITLTAGSTGATKGTLTRTAAGTYELALAGITASGDITVAVAKDAYAISPANKTVAVSHYTPPDPDPGPAPAPGGYTGGNTGSTYTGNEYPGSFAGGALTVQGPCANLTSVMVDNAILTRERDYTVNCGSTIITFTPSYLASLKNGAHTVKVQFTDGRYMGTFTTPLTSAVTAVPDVPATGGQPAAMAIFVWLLSGAAILSRLRRQLL